MYINTFDKGRALIKVFTHLHLLNRSGNKKKNTHTLFLLCYLCCLEIQTHNTGNSTESNAGIDREPDRQDGYLSCSGNLLDSRQTSSQRNKKKKSTF